MDASASFTTYVLCLFFAALRSFIHLSEHSVHRSSGLLTALEHHWTRLSVERILLQPHWTRQCGRDSVEGHKYTDYMQKALLILLEMTNHTGFSSNIDQMFSA